MPETFFEKRCLALAYNSCVLVAALRHAGREPELHVPCTTIISSCCVSWSSCVPRVCKIIVPFKYSIQTGRGEVLRSWHHAEGISTTVRRCDRLSDDLRHRFGAGACVGAEQSARVCRHRPACSEHIQRSLSMSCIYGRAAARRRASAIALSKREQSERGGEQGPASVSWVADARFTRTRYASPPVSPP